MYGTLALLISFLLLPTKCVFDLLPRHMTPDGVILLITRVFQKKNPNHDDEPLFNFHSIIISSLAEILGLTASILMVERVGRIKPQALFFALGGAFSFILSLSASSGSSVVFLTVISFCLKMFEMGSSTLLWVTTAESLPTEIRTTGEIYRLFWAIPPSIF
jgi:hypothetical protein